LPSTCPLSYGTFLSISFLPFAPLLGTVRRMSVPLVFNAMFAVGFAPKV